MVASSVAPDLQTAIEELISSAVGSASLVSNLAIVPGGASRETWRFDLSTPSGAYAGDRQLVLRRELGGKIYSAALDVAAEFEVIRAVFDAGVPCPRPHWFCRDLLGRPAMVSSRLAGESIGRRIVRDPSLQPARSGLPAAMGAALASIHRVPLDSTGFGKTLPTPPPGETPARVAILMMEADLDRIDEPHPALELCLRWLRRNEPPPPPSLVLVHGDFRIGNVLVSLGGLEGVIDWEFAHVGEPGEDLAWGLVREWRFGVDHQRFGGVGQPSEFFRAYEEHGGQTVDLPRVAYWEIMGNARWAIGALNQARRHLSGQEPNLEYASLGRRCGEMELEALRLIRAFGG